MEPLDLSLGSPGPDVLSAFFTGAAEECPNAGTAERFLRLVERLNARLSVLPTPRGVECIYNATEYARGPFELYVRRYCDSTRRIMLFGMNPGPWGMSQTGVPFGEVNAVRDWLKIEGPVGKPPRELAARPVKGFDCTRSEISGKRFWGLFRDLCGEPENFFSSSFVYNYLPQQWMKANGCNVTPSDYKSSEMQELYDICDPILCRVLELYEVETVVAIGKFCETRAAKALKRYSPGRDVKIVYLPHPSPRTINNTNWSEKAAEHLRNLNLMQFYSRDVRLRGDAT